MKELTPSQPLHPKDNARLAYQASARRQDHGSRQAYQGHVHEKDPHYAGKRPVGKPESIAALLADHWSADEQGQRESAAHLAHIYHDDPDMLDMSDLDYLTSDDFADIEGRQDLADDLLQELYRGEISTEQAMEKFLAGVSAMETDRPLAEQASDQLRDHLAYSGRMAAARTLEYNPFDDTDYLDGLSIREW